MGAFSETFLSQLDDIKTPAFVYDLELSCFRVGLLADIDDLQSLYSIKSLPISPLLKALVPNIAGFSVSSLNEARYARDILGPKGLIHITSPGLRADEDQELVELCSSISCNSINQFHRLSRLNPSSCTLGVRVNPGLSFLDDPRYDPCRAHSKLGVPLEQLEALIKSDPDLSDAIHGLHFHTQYGSTDFLSMKQTLNVLEDRLGDFFAKLDWINLGGGYLFQTAADLDILQNIVSDLRQRWGLKILFEPGRAIVGDAGYLVCSVVDVFTSDGETIVVLDTSVNHLPEVFEYQKSPALLAGRPSGRHIGLKADPQGEDKTIKVHLAGNTCKSGDVFGQFQLTAVPKTGDRFVFKDVGAYSLVKAHRFNGYGLPTIYIAQGESFSEYRTDNYQDYRRQW